ncbi:hypothetical protein [Lysinibacillus fusiformis]|uniref:hypothetical protein n=1 Tax=Lysinibacillus fusiformis TaxID=28031 RepID=UPI0020BDB150|nr:hypothetical protein [Lysinibacillus fusiformis]
MTQTSRAIPGATVRGTASGVFFMAFFGTLWAYTGIMGLHGWGVPLLLVTAVAIGIALFIGGFSLIRASRELTNQVSKTDLRQGKRTSFWFNIIFAAESLAIAITIAVCNATRHPELIPVVIALIVGVHFFPLAPLFQVRLYYFTATLTPLFTCYYDMAMCTYKSHTGGTSNQYIYVCSGLWLCPDLVGNWSCNMANGQKIARYRPEISEKELSTEKVKYVFS